MSEPDPTVRTCPKCRAALEHVERRGLVVESCPGCQGMWFDAGELNRLLEMVPRYEPGSGTATGLGCVGCGAPLLEHTLPHTNVRVDRCDACQGVWLDASELEQLKEQLAAIVPPDDPLWAKRAQAKIDEAERDALARARCRDCEGRLQHVTRGRVVVDVCGACGGTWFDAGELTTVLGVSRTVGLKGAAPTARRCVRCPDEGLVETVYPRTDVPLSVCPSCRGAWVGAGDLARIAAAAGVAL